MKRKLLLIKTLSIFLLSNFVVRAQNMIFERIYDETLSQASYIIANENKEAIVIDPKRDIDTYIDFAKQNGLEIKYVTETHIHADFLSGSRELAQVTNAKLLLSAEGGDDWQYSFLHEPLNDLQKIYFGNLEIEVMHTPGHTPESISFLIRNLKNTSEPIKAVTGDFIFVGDVGRPDLLEKTAGKEGSQFVGASQLFESLNKFINLPKNTELWPGHGAGSFCGKSLSTVPQSTLEQEMSSSMAFKYLNDKKAFIEFVLDGQPEPPKYFSTMKEWNKSSRPLLIEIPKLKKLTNTEALKAYENNILIIDTRRKEEVAKEYIPGSLHIENSTSFSTFVGSLVSYNQPILLIASEAEIRDIQRKLIRIGMDNLYGYITEVKNFKNLKSSKIITAEEVLEYKKDKKVQLIDVRTASEYESGHIKGFENMSLNSLDEMSIRIQKDVPVIIHCQSGVRAAMAYSILERLGFTTILNYSGSINDWKAKKLPLVK